MKSVDIALFYQKIKKRKVVLESLKSPFSFIRELRMVNVLKMANSPSNFYSLKNKCINERNIINSMFPKIITYLVIFMWICLSLGSCTYDYLVSEKNVRLYVPQLVNKEIQTLAIVFHGKDGEFLLSKTISYEDIELNDGHLIRLAVPVSSFKGSDVIVTCASDLDKDVVSSGTDFGTSRITSFSDNVNRFFPTADYRFFNHETIVYPLGVSSSIDTLDITKDYLHKGEIELVFNSPHPEFYKVRVEFYHLGSSLYFDGEYKSQGGDYIEFESVLSGDPATISTMLLPSIGQQVHDSTGIQNSGSQLDFIKFDVYFYSRDGLLGTYHLNSESDTTGMPSFTDPADSSKPPIPANEAILRSKGKLRFEFEGFTLFKFEVNDWEGITEGETTPM